MGSSPTHGTNGANKVRECRTERAEASEGGGVDGLAKREPVTESHPWHQKVIGFCLNYRGNMINSSDLKVGKIFQEGNQPYKVERYSHSKVARSGATIKIKARNLITGDQRDFTYSGSDKVEEADTRNKNVQYLYNDGASYYFMDPESYEQFSISKNDLGSSADYLQDGQTIQVLLFQDKPVSIDLPISMVFEIIYTEPGHKGNTVTNAYKDADLSNGLRVKVPMFMKIGDSVKIDTRNGEYMSKA